MIPLLATTLIGSYPQPDWLIDRGRLRSSLPARVRARVNCWGHVGDTALEGMDINNPAMVADRPGGTNALPRVVGRIRRTRPVEVDDLRFLRGHTDRAVKITLPGPFTMSQQAHNEAYAPVETAEQVAERIERALEVVPAERLLVAPDCGMKYLPRQTAYAKLCSLVEGAALVRARL